MRGFKPQSLYLQLLLFLGLPLLLLCYLVAYLDRVNVGFAKVIDQDPA